MESDIQLVAHEAEVLWGREPVELLEPLRKCVAKLKWAVGTYLRVRSERDRDGGVYESASKIVFSMGADPKEDPFGAKLKKAVTKVENFVRPRLK